MKEQRTRKAPSSDQGDSVRQNETDPKGPPRSMEEVQDASNEDLSFHGWRDWALVIVGGPIFLAAIVLAARGAIGGKGPLPVVAWPIAIAIVAISLIMGLIWRRSSRRARHRQPFS
jgi:hypothetical protein